MANESRFLGKQLVQGDGVVSSSQAAIVQEGNVWTLIGGERIGGSGTPILQLASVLASLDVAQIEPAGSTGAQVVNVALASVAVGDLCFASPVQSVPLGIVWGAACYTAGAINVRVLHTQSGNIDLAATDWRVGYMRFG